MSEDDMGVLRTLARIPRRELTQSEKPLVLALLGAGYVTYGPDGWIATNLGCALIEKRAATLH